MLFFQVSDLSFRKPIPRAVPIRGLNQPAAQVLTTGSRADIQRLQFTNTRPDCPQRPIAQQYAIRRSCSVNVACRRQERGAPGPELGDDWRRVQVWTTRFDQHRHPRRAAGIRQRPAFGTVRRFRDRSDRAGHGQIMAGQPIRRRRRKFLWECRPTGLWLRDVARRRLAAGRLGRSCWVGRDSSPGAFVGRWKVPTPDMWY